MTEPRFDQIRRGQIHRGQIRQREASVLADAYTSPIRWLDGASITAFLAALAWLFWRVAPLAWASPSLMAVCGLSAYVIADFVSGLFHWMGDTWGTPDTPFVGKVFVRAFREHHVDQTAITRHDFIEVNGANCLISLPVVVAAHAALAFGGAAYAFAVFFAAMFVLAIFATNQFHKWSHAERCPAAVAWLQRWHLILPREHHQTHHAAPYDKYYCITVGWLNEPLERIHFFRLLERVISATTGMVPRRDDIGEEAAKALAEAQAAGPDWPTPEWPAGEPHKAPSRGG